MDCVAGRGRETALPRTGARDALTPRVWLDDCFPSTRREGISSQVCILVVLEEDTGAVDSLPVTEKGPAEYPVKTVTKAIEAWGLKRVVGVTDGEAAIKALLAAVKLERKDETVCS